MAMDALRRARSLVEKSGAKLRKLDFQVAEIKYEALGCVFSSSSPWLKLPRKVKPRGILTLPGPESS